MIRATTRSWRSAAPDRCMPAPSPRNSACAGSSSRCTPERSRRTACSAPISGGISFNRSSSRSASLTTTAIGKLTRGLVERSRNSVSDLGSAAVKWRFQADCRYRGQAYEVAVDIPSSPPLVQKIVQQFHRRHQRQFGFSEPNAEIELVNLRAISTVARRKPKLPDVSAAHGVAVTGDRGRIFAGGESVEAMFVSRASLQSGQSASGPLVIEEGTATGYIPRGWSMSVSAQGHIDVARDGSHVR